MMFPIDLWMAGKESEALEAILEGGYQYEAAELAAQITEKCGFAAALSFVQMLKDAE